MFAGEFQQAGQIGRGGEAADGLPGGRGDRSVGGGGGRPQVGHGPGGVARGKDVDEADGIGRCSVAQDAADAAVGGIARWQVDEGRGERLGERCVRAAQGGGEGRGGCGFAPPAQGGGGGEFSVGVARGQFLLQRGEGLRAGKIGQRGGEPSSGGMGKRGQRLRQCGRNVGDVELTRSSGGQRGDDRITFFQRGEDATRQTGGVAVGQGIPRAAPDRGGGTGPHHVLQRDGIRMARGAQEVGLGQAGRAGERRSRSRVGNAGQGDAGGVGEGGVGIACERREQGHGFRFGASTEGVDDLQAGQSAGAGEGAAQDLAGLGRGMSGQGDAGEVGFLGGGGEVGPRGQRGLACDDREALRGEQAGFAVGGAAEHAEQLLLDGGAEGGVGGGGADAGVQLGAGGEGIGAAAVVQRGDGEGEEEGEGGHVRSSRGSGVRGRACGWPRGR